jgi:hypothetical protein
LCMRPILSGTAGLQLTVTAHAQPGTHTHTDTGMYPLVSPM